MLELGAQYFKPKIACYKTYTASENLSNKWFSSNYWSLNNQNLLLESSNILKRKWHKTTKNGMLKLRLMKAL